MRKERERILREIAIRTDVWRAVEGSPSLARRQEAEAIQRMIREVELPAVKNRKRRVAKVVRLRSVQ